jgi:DNA-binding transcriptional LysR family regulator
MELNQIKYFVTLAGLLHFTKAAEACHVSQPALTKAIQKLEDELGGPLFHRERSRTRLTDLGRLMLVPMERMLTAARDAKLQADTFRKREASPLRVGLEYSVPTSVLTPVLATLRWRTPELELSLRHGSQTDLCERMLAGDLDVALLVESEDLHERLHRWEMFAEHYVVIFPPEHRFRDLDVVHASDLAEECLLLNEDKDCPVRRFADEICVGGASRPRRRHYATSQEQILEMVQASLGITLAGERLRTASPLLRRTITVHPHQRHVVLASVAGRQLGPTPALFLKLMRARAWSTDKTTPAPIGAAAA